MLTADDLCKQFGLERLTWTGKTPFEIKEVRAQPDGFLLTFTRPVDRATAEQPESYTITGFTYLYHKAYGSPAVNQLGCPVRKVVVAADGLSVRLAAGCLREGYIHEIKAAGLRERDAREPLLHPTAYYTMNRFARGDCIIPIDPKDMELCRGGGAVAMATSRKHPDVAPSRWGNKKPDVDLAIGTLPGLKFDRTLLVVKAGQRVRLSFRNSDDMLHNWVLCAPGRGQAVGEAAMALGLEGTAKSFVPEGDDVLYHTSLLQPQTDDTLYFTAPTVPGEYDFICTFPGHALLMKGILRVQ